MNISTVYRTLELLEKLGLVSHTHLGHGAPAYHATTEPDHLHLVCRNCERVTEVEPTIAAGLVGDVAARFGFRTDLRHLTVFGISGSARDDPRVAGDGSAGVGEVVRVLRLM